MATEPGSLNLPLSIDPTLPFGDINLIALTDVHSWVGGHRGREGLDVSYGEVVAFFERLKEYCYHDLPKTTCGDLWLVQNGDWVDGTGLSMDGDTSLLAPLLEDIPFDVINTGNHEIYKDSVIESMKQPGGFLEFWGPKHLASNVFMKIKKNVAKNNITEIQANSTANTVILEPMSNRYHVLKGRRSTVLVFGFIYDLPDPSDLLLVQPAKEAVKEEWFQNVLLNTSIGYNAILVMLHAGLDDPSLELIRTEIRKVTQQKVDPDGNLPIQFVAGHTHFRRHGIADPQSTVIEPGRYMDTVGWVSFPNSHTIRDHKQIRDKSGNATNIQTNETITLSSDSTSDNTTPTVTSLFRHVFLDANQATLRAALGILPNRDFQTPRGEQIATRIQTTRDAMGLTRHIGCAPRDYLINRSMDHLDSLWGLYRDEIGPHGLATVQLVEGGKTRSISEGDRKMTFASNSYRRMLFISQDSWRYGLYGDIHLTYDDIIVVTPFNEIIFRVSILPCFSIKELLYNMNAADEAEIFYNNLPAWILSEYHNNMPTKKSLHFKERGKVEFCELYVNDFGLARVKNGLEAMRGKGNVQWNPIATDITTTSIWLSFVKDKWQCLEQTYDASIDFGSLYGFTVFAPYVFLCFIFVQLRLLRKGKSRKKKRASAAPPGNLQPNIHVYSHYEDKMKSYE